MSRGANSLSIKVNMGGLKSLLAQIGDDLDAAVRPASQAAAQVLYDEAKSNVMRINRKTGNLAKSIYQAFSDANSGPKKATYHISWNARTAPHAGLVEYGHLMRYKMYRREDGQIRPMVRAGMEGKKKPGRNASQAQKDAYYVTLPTPLQIAAKPFMSPVLSKFPAALEAAEAELLKRINMGRT